MMIPILMRNKKVTLIIILTTLLAIQSAYIHWYLRPRYEICTNSNTISLEIQKEVVESSYRSMYSYIEAQRLETLLNSTSSKHTDVNCTDCNVTYRL